MLSSHALQGRVRQTLGAFVPGLAQLGQTQVGSSAHQGSWLSTARSASRCLTPVLAESCGVPSAPGSTKHRQGGGEWWLNS